MTVNNQTISGDSDAWRITVGDPSPYTQVHHAKFLLNWTTPNFSWTVPYSNSTDLYLISSDLYHNQFSTGLYHEHFSASLFHTRSKNIAKMSNAPICTACCVWLKILVWEEFDEEIWVEV